MKAPLVVIGPGAVGGLLAAILDRSGQPVGVLGGTVTNDAIRRDGITVESALLGEWIARPRVYDAMPPGAHVLLTVKEPGLSDALELLEHNPPVEVVSLLNGVNHAATIRARLPEIQLAACAMTVEATRSPDSVVAHRSTFLRVSASKTAAGSALLNALGTAGITVDYGESEVEVLWHKFRFLAPMALLTAYHRQPLGPALDADPTLTQSLVGEVADIASAAGLATSHTELDAILRGFPSAMRSSLQNDLDAGRLGELHSIGSGLLNVAIAAGLASDTITSVLDAIDHPHRRDIVRVTPPIGVSTPQGLTP